MVKRSILAVFLAVFVITLTPTFTFAQAVYGSIIGTVTDPQGAAIPNAKVTVTSTTKGTSVEVVSNADGNYTVIHLIPDTYNVRVEVEGFKSFEAKDIRVFADQGARLDAALAVGGLFAGCDEDSFPTSGPVTFPECVSATQLGDFESTGLAMDDSGFLPGAM